MPTAKQVMDVARSQIGYTEGANNKNKYGKAYGSNYVSWCAIFEWWCGKKAAEKYGGLNPFPKNASAAYNQEDIVRRGGRWILPKTTSAKTKKAALKKLKPGDVIAFDFGKKEGYRDHTGLIESVDGETIITIEGNTQPDGKKEKYDGVHRKHRNYKDMCSVVRPRYTKEKKE